MAFLKQLRPALLFLAVIFCYATVRHGVGAGLHLVAFSLGAGALVGLIAVPFSVKSTLVKATATGDLRRATESEFAWLDAATFHHLTESWEKLGFEVQQEWVRNASHPQLGVSFMRFLENHESATLVEIAQIQLPNATQPVWQCLASYWAMSHASDILALAQEPPQTVAPLADPHPTTPRVEFTEELPLWSMSVTTRKQNWIANILQHPRVIGKQATTDIPSELWAQHQALQAQVSRALEQKPLQGQQTEIALAHARLLLRIWHVRLQKSRAIPLLWRAWRSGTKKTEYWGELEDRIQEH